MDPDLTAPLWSGIIVIAFMIKTSLKCTCIYAADVISRQHFQDKKYWQDYKTSDLNCFSETLTLWLYSWKLILKKKGKKKKKEKNGPRSTVRNVSSNKCESDCRSRGGEFDLGPVPYFRWDWSWNNLYGHSPSFPWIVQEGLLSVTSESLCTKYWLTACSSLPRKKCG